MIWAECCNRRMPALALYCGEPVGCTAQASQGSTSHNLFAPASSSCAPRTLYCLWCGCSQPPSLFTAARSRLWCSGGGGEQKVMKENKARSGKILVFTYGGFPHSSLVFISFSLPHPLPCLLPVLHAHLPSAWTSKGWPCGRSHVRLVESRENEALPGASL